MAQVPAAGGASHLGTDPTHGGILKIYNGVLRQGLEETWPATMRVELAGASKQLCTTGPAGVDSLGFGIGVLTHEWGFSTSLAQHVVLLRGQRARPKILGLLDLIFGTVGARWTVATRSGLAHVDIVVRCGPG